MNAKWSVLAVYRDTAARDETVKFCDCLIQRFWPEITFDLVWQDWSALLDKESAKESGFKAERADMIVLATAGQGTLDRHIRTWLEAALARRGDREGILVGLSTPDCSATAGAAATQQYLRKLAHRSGLDYLTTVPQSLCRGVPESVEAYALRATKVTSVLDTILHCVPPPPSVL